MYTMVLMAALSGSGDVSAFGKKSSGCCGGEVVASCHGGESEGCCGGKAGFLGLKGKMGGLFGKHKSKGCDGSCHGTVVEAPACDACAAPAPAPAPVDPCALPAHAAPVHVAPAAPAPAAPAAPAPTPMPEKKTTGSV